MGFPQREGVDYNKTFAPVVRYSNIRLLLTIAAHRGLLVHQLDVDTAILYGELKEDIYMYPPTGYIINCSNRSNTILKLVKSSGLEQAPNVRYEQVNKFLVSELGFTRVADDYVQDGK